jgi:hypothetical protein|nr:MAG TPA: hypothetical protein [Caudoviricetes sp.]
MKKQVFLDKASKGKLRQIFGCTDVMVWKAITYESNSSLARKIRHVAINELGGELVGDGVIKFFETTHQTAEHTMTQAFGERVKIVRSLKTDRTVVMVDGVIKKTEDDLSIPDFMKLQQEVLLIANEI